MSPGLILLIAIPACLAGVALIIFVLTFVPVPVHMPEWTSMLQGWASRLVDLL